MNSNRFFSYLIILSLLLTGCITEYNAILPENDRIILFVDGSIIENTDATFHISQSFSLNVDTVTKIPEESFINNANLVIIGSNGYKSLAAINKGKGVYQISVGELKDDVEYGIQIEYEGDIYQSALSKPLYTPEIDSISWSQPEAEGQVFFHVSTHDNTGRAKFFMWNYTEDWEIKAVYPTIIFYNPNHREQLQEPFYLDDSMPYYYCWKKNLSDKSLLASTESLSENRIVDELLYERDSGDDRFSMLYCLTVNQRAISKGAYEYYQSIKKMNEETGGLFTPQPTEITGNITCITDPSKKIMGFIETSKNISQKRIFVDPVQLIRQAVYLYCDPLYNVYEPPPPILRLPKPDEYDYYYGIGYRPSILDIGLYGEGAIIPSEWAFARCTDCRAAGGTKDKPDFWPSWNY